MKKIILHLCADIGSDTTFYQDDSEYEVIKIGKSIGVENYNAPKTVYGIIANPPCTEFSVVNKGYHQHGDYVEGMRLVQECQRIIKQANPIFWVIENPATGRLKDFLGKPDYSYEPWEFGSPWTKRTALWGKFNSPKKLYTNWAEVPKNPHLYIRPTRKKPSMAQLHKSAIIHIPEFNRFINTVQNDMDLRSLCSQKFAKEFYKNNL